MTDCQNRDLGVQFDHHLKLMFVDSKVTTDGTVGGNACVTIWGNSYLERFQRNPYVKYQIRVDITSGCR